MNKGYKNKQENKFKNSHKGIEELESSKKFEINHEVENKFKNIYKRIGKLEAIIKLDAKKKNGKQLNNIHKKINELEDLRNLNINESIDLLAIYEFIKDLKKDEKQIISIYLENKLKRSYGLNYYLTFIMSSFLGIGGMILGGYTYLNMPNEFKIIPIISTIILFIICFWLIIKTTNLKELRFYNFILTCINNYN